MKPPTRLCDGWACAFYASPDAYRLLPEPIRVHKALTSFGPKGAWWLRDRIEGTVEVLSGHALTSAEPKGSEVLLRLDGAAQTAIEADPFIAGTGFRIDISRLPFLPEETRASLVTRANCPW